MPKTIDQIRELKEHYITDLYLNVRKEQKTDQTYRDDTFSVPEVRTPHKIYRSGIGARMVDAPAEQIVTSNPLAFFEILKGNKDISIRLSKEVNNWIDILRRQNPNPFKESVKNKLCRGENYIQVVHNESWVTGAKQRYGLPVKFLIRDPMIIYASPEEDEDGNPLEVIIFYDRQPLDVIVRYPYWSNPQKAGLGERKNAKVQWLEYHSGDSRYFEADGEPVLKGGIQPNIYGFNSFVRQRSGFGRRSPDGELANLIVSDIRLSRDLIAEECITRSDIASILHLFAHKDRTIVSPGDINEEQVRNLEFGAYSLNVLANVPEGTTLEEDKAGEPSTQTFQHLRDIQSEIAQRNPFIMSGFPQGSSGRQQGMSEMAAMRRYDTVIENTENEWATAFEMALKICHPSIVPTLKPDGLNKPDLNATYKCQVKLKAPDPIEEDRLATLGDRLWGKGNGCIDLRTNLIQYQGKAEDEAEEIIANIMVDKLTLYNPDVASVYGMVFAEESQLEGAIQKAQQRRQMMEEQQKALQGQASKTTEERTMGEAETLEGPEPQRGARTPPTRYKRGE